ncbi:MAG: amidohydrolase, partial [Pedobacter sp.]
MTNGINGIFINLQAVTLQGIGLIHGKNPGSRIVALRADIDALPILEE